MTDVEVLVVKFWLLMFFVGDVILYFRAPREIRSGHLWLALPGSGFYVWYKAAKQRKDGNP